MAKGLLIIKTLTPTHPGAGTSIGAIDLMLQREVTTNFPFIQGSSLKGAMRSYLESQPVEDKEDLLRELINLLEQYANDQKNKDLMKELNKVKKSDGSIELPVFRAREFVRILIKARKDDKAREEVENRFSPLYSEYDKVFGPYSPKGGFEKGALTITDASLLFYPVRTLKGLYALVTCPEILRRLKMPHIGLLKDSDIPQPDKGTVLGHPEALKKYMLNNNRLYFEDLNFKGDKNEIGVILLKSLGFEGEMNKKNSDLYKIASRLFIVHDDVFQYFVEFATQVMSRNKIDYNTGTVDKKIGGIWTEEHLPPETYLFSYLEDDKKVVGKIKVKKNGSEQEKDATSFEWIADKLDDNVIHLGGDETVGKGFVELRFKGL